MPHHESRGDDSTIRLTRALKHRFHEIGRIRWINSLYPHFLLLAYGLLCAIPRMGRCFNHRPSWIEPIHDVLLLDKVEGADLAEDPGKIIVELLSGN